ncbi:hypothetical protein D3C84_1184070 [compost metagenome]
MGQMIAKRAGHAWVVHGLTEGGEAANQPQRPEGLVPKNVQGAMTVWAVEQGKGNDTDRREASADHQGIGQDHGHRLAQ